MSTPNPLQMTHDALHVLADIGLDLREMSAAFERIGNSTLSHELEDLRRRLDRASIQLRDAATYAIKERLAASEQATANMIGGMLGVLSK